MPDRLAADVFQKSYRRFLQLKPTHYRWSHLAPQSVVHLQTACEEHWSVEKLADYLHCPPEEAVACLRRFTMSKKINSKENTAARMRQAVSEWLGGVGDWDEGARWKMADELAKHIGNQLFLAAQAKEDLLAISLELEGEEPQAKPKGQSGAAAAEEPPKWGPQWKD
ncbi:MAG: hypothetical protein ABI036_16235 [Fibrobacteria bacterium]